MKNFLFDLDMTLLDFHASEHVALEMVVKAHGLTYTEDIYDYFKTLNKSLWLKLEKGIITRTELFTIRFTDIIGRCGGDPALIDPMEVNNEFIHTMSCNGVLMDGALDFLRKVKEEIKDSRVYILSNGATVNAMGRIKSTGLDRYIDGVYISEDLGVNKPAKEFFDICLDKIGEAKETCIMIGDSLTSDMKGAQNAELTSVWFMPAGDIESAIREYDIDYCALSFEELFDVLKDWAKRE